MDQPKAKDKNSQHKKIHHRVVGEIDESQELAARDALDAIFGVSERRLNAEKINHLRQRQCHHRKVDALPPHRKPANEVTDHRRAGGAKQYRQFGRPAPNLGGMPTNVGGQTEKHGVTKREQSGKANKQIKCARKQTKAEAGHQENWITDERRGDSCSEQDHIE